MNLSVCSLSIAKSSFKFKIDFAQCKNLEIGNNKKCSLRELPAHCVMVQQVKHRHVNNLHKWFQSNFKMCLGG